MEHKMPMVKFKIKNKMKVKYCFLVLLLIYNNELFSQDVIPNPDIKYKRNLDLVLQKNISPLFEVCPRSGRSNSSKEVV